MSDGLKTGLILAGAGVAAFLLYEHSRGAAVAAGVPSVPGTGSNLATAPGAAPAPTTAGSSPASSGGGRSTTSTILHYTALAAVAPLVLPTKAAIVGAKAVGGAVESVFKDIF
jgi:hypothetical protein